MQAVSCVLRPPSSFRLAEKKMVRARARRKGRFHAGFPSAFFEPVPADDLLFPKTGCNRGIGCRLCFRAETLRLALHGAGGNVLYRVTWFGVFFSDRGPCETLVGQRKTSDSCGHPAHRLSQRQPHSAPFSFLHRARRCLSFRASTEKKDRGAQHAANGLQTGTRKRIATAVCALPRNDAQDRTGNKETERIAQLTACIQATENGLPRRFAPRKDGY